MKYLDTIYEAIKRHEEKRCLTGPERLHIRDDVEEELKEEIGLEPDSTVDGCLLFGVRVTVYPNFGTAVPFYLESAR